MRSKMLEKFLYMTTTASAIEWACAKGDNQSPNNCGIAKSSIICFVVAIFLLKGIRKS